MTYTNADFELSEKKTGYYNYLISLFYLKGHERYPKCNAICFDFVFKYTENYYIIQIDSFYSVLD